MRKRLYISPTQLKMWVEDKKKYYLNYLAETKIPRTPQSLAMAYGSSFDVKVKYALARRFKVNEFLAEDEEETLEAQIEVAGVREMVDVGGDNLLEAYKVSGAFGDLCAEIGDVQNGLRMEFTVMTDIHGVPMMLKPDLFFNTTAGMPMIVDWKVNGAASKGNTSPKAGFIRCRDGWTTETSPHSRGNMTAHKNCNPQKVGGVTVNLNGRLAIEWERQLTLYALGMGSGGDTSIVAGIEQLACKRFNGLPYPRCASHRVLITPEQQKFHVDQLVELWDCVNSDHIFRSMSKSDSQELCEHYEEEAKSLAKKSEYANIFRKW